jgi:predicted DNA-binding transcriptional regulator YafY
VRRADRLFQIVQRLRLKGRGVTTAAELAEELGVSERTIYRDVRDLQLSGVPIRGEAGVGYALPKGTFDLPPLMFTRDEIEALVLGARVVEAWADPDLARAAKDALGKVEAVLPPALKDRLASATLFALNFRDRAALDSVLPALRGAIRESRKVELDYRDRAEASTTRTVLPLGLFYWGVNWTLGAWCELRTGFRNFRLDRIASFRVLDESFQPEPGRTLADLFTYYRDERSRD